MDFINYNWNSDSYHKFIDYLFSLQDIKYRDFHTSLVGGTNIIGIRTNILRDVAEDIFKGNYKEFLLLCNNNYYEEIIIYGFVICNIKDINESIKYLEKYKNKINSWASCDLFASSYKIIKKNKEYYWDYINNNINSENYWIRRLCFVFILDYFIEEEYLDDIFKLCDKYNTNDYYANMAVAWLISICYIKHKNKTIHYIKNNKLDDFTHNKIISKIRDSYRVEKEDKEYLNSLKR